MAEVTGSCLRHLGELASDQLPRALLAAEDEGHLSPGASPSPPPPPSFPPGGSVGHFRPSMAVIVGILTTMFSITFLLLLYAKHCRRTMGAGRPYRGGAGTSFLGGVATVSGRRNSGVERSVVESLPLFRFGSLQMRKGALECAVCLGRFDDEELLRLLPKCKHTFHVECVDTWLDAHSTCPICRHRVDPEDVLLAFHEYAPPAGPKPHPAIDAEGTSKSREPAGVLPAAAVTPSPVAAFGFFRSTRISGRHSSAGEKRSDSALLQVVVQRPGLDAPGQRSSVDNALLLRAAAMASKASIGCFDRGGRKDQLLLAENAPAVQQPFEHRIVISGEGDLEGGSGGRAAVPRRWSDMRPQDLLHLRRDMTLVDGAARASSCSSSAVSYGADRVAISSRSVSEITGLSRFAAGRVAGAPAGVGRAAEERMLRRWLSLASKRAGRWLGRRVEPGGSGPEP
ncbi:hypothetical protein Taro_023652 [Colocasia esculenta]|uniref:RING-type E3 ubiquitin transferase n=1 Tax=Colocasia esculenta TaxID=4460 RepID=A0A843V713_COLES|nr:hypothetical protein [Colocasia esculenta]